MMMMTSSIGAVSLFLSDQELGIVIVILDAGIVEMSDDVG